MSLLIYLLYVFAAFSLYMIVVLGPVVFVELVMPWLGFMVVIFAPLVWMHIRSERKEKRG